MEIMAHRPPTLRGRSHRRKRQPHQFSWGTPHPGRSVITAADVDDTERIQEQTLLLPDLPCDACGRFMMRGTTIFLISTQDARHFRCCATCGDAIRQHCGF